MTKKLRRVRINRAKWIRGGKNGLGDSVETTLCDREDQRCCLGFAMNQISRIPYIRLQNQFAPECVVGRGSFLTNLRGHNNIFAMDAIMVNDDHNLSDADRESKLVKLFRQQGIILTFYGKTYDDIARSD
jgi:hypothetical protein